MNELVVLVTGGSRGVGRGVAVELARTGAHVYATGRSIEHADLPDSVVRIVCDHTDDDAVAAAFDRVRSDRGYLDILINSAWGGVAVISLYPGLVRTEAVLAAGVFDLSNSESPEFIGRIVAALYQSPRLMERSGAVLVAADVARELGIEISTAAVRSR